MENEKDILLEFNPHTRAKHEILSRYIAVWTPVLTMRFNGKVVYIDGFAGSGAYRNSDELGSPQIVLDTILNRKFLPKIKTDIFLLFIELNKDRAKHLEGLLKARYTKLPNNIKYNVEIGEFDRELNAILDTLKKEHSRLAPTFCFVDPYGWSDLNYDTLAKFMNEEKAELLITFMVGFLSRFIEEARLTSIKKLFSEEQVKTITETDKDSRSSVISKIFIDNLKDKIHEINPNKKIFDLSFQTIDSHDNTMYYLLYLTSHLKGLKVMKEAMFSTGERGSYMFNDFTFNPSGKQSTLINYNDVNYWQTNAGNELHKEFEGKKCTVNEVENYTWMNTRWIFRKGILHRLEDKGLIKYLSDRKRKRLTYADDGLLEFV